MSYYWYYPADNTYSECDQDGNHEPVDEKDLPTVEQQDQAWKDYYEYVARTGLDPIDAFILPTLPKKIHSWQAIARNWIGAKTHGLKIIGLRRRSRGPWMNPSEAKQDIRQFIYLDEKTHCMTCINTLQELKDLVSCKVQNDLEVWFTFDVEEEPQPWSETRTQAWLKRKAKETLSKRN